MIAPLLLNDRRTLTTALKEGNNKGNLQVLKKFKEEEIAPARSRLYFTGSGLMPWGFSTDTTIES